MARRSQAESEATAEDVLRHAEQMFGRHGYRAVGLEEVARAAGVTRGAVYHHFGSKLGLFDAVVRRAHARVADSIVTAAQSRATGWEALEAGCRAFLESSTDESSCRILFTDAPAVLGWSVWRAHDANTSVVHLAESVQELVAAGEMRVGSPAAVTAMLSGAMNEAALWVADQDDRERALTWAWADFALVLDALRQRPPTTGHGPTR